MIFAVLDPSPLHIATTGRNDMGQRHSRTSPVQWRRSVGNSGGTLGRIHKAWMGARGWGRDGVLLPTGERSGAGYLFAVSATPDFACPARDLADG